MMEALVDAHIRTMHTLLGGRHYVAASAVGEWCVLSQNLNFNKDVRVKLWFELTMVAVACSDATGDPSFTRTGIVAECIRSMMKLISCQQHDINIPYFVHNIVPITNALNRSLIVSGLAGEKVGSLKRHLNRAADKVSDVMRSEWIERKQAGELDEPVTQQTIASAHYLKLRLSHSIHPRYKTQLFAIKWEDLMEMFPNDWEVVFHTGVARLHRAMLRRQTSKRGIYVIMAIACLKRYQVLRIGEANAQENRMHGGKTRLSKRDLELETWFNVGRAFHYVSINFLAINCYVKALAGSDAVSVEDVISMSEEGGAESASSAPFDLRKQTAHNLVLLLRASPDSTVRAQAQQLIRLFLTLK